MIHAKTRSHSRLALPPIKQFKSPAADVLIQFVIVEVGEIPSLQPGIELKDRMRFCPLPEDHPSQFLVRVRFTCGGLEEKRQFLRSNRIQFAAWRNIRKGHRSPCAIPKSPEGRAARGWGFRFVARWIRPAKGGCFYSTIPGTSLQ